MISSLATTKHFEIGLFERRYMMWKKMILILIMFIYAGAVHGEDALTKSENTYNVPVSAQYITPLLIGSSVPEIQLTTIDGAIFDLNQAFSNRPTILIFYRGGWCPYCDTQLGQLQQIEENLVALGYQIFAISPDRPNELSKTIEKDKLTYTLLSDATMNAALAFGIAFRIDDPTLKKYQSYGIDLERASGEDHHLLPVPSVFIVDQDGTINFTYVNPDYRVRIDPELLLAAAKASLKIESQK